MHSASQYSKLYKLQSKRDGMKKRNDRAKWAIYEREAEKLVTPIVEANQLQLVDVEYVLENGIFYLRVYIDKEGGITFEDCKRVNNPFSKLLDKANLIDDSYMLEISSPGLGRSIRKDRDFQRNIGREIEVHTYKAVNKRKLLIGMLAAWDASSITMTLPDGESVVIERSNISVLKEYVDFDELERQADNFPFELEDEDE